MLCVKGCGFYGSNKKNGYCSRCYESLTDITKPVLSEIKMKKRCEECKRKVGINGFLCKCNKIFCARHRLPFEHNCTFDHVAQEKKKIEKSNPKIVKQKFEKI